MTTQPTGDFHCWICGTPGGHGSIPCPQLQVGTPFGYPGSQDYSLHAKLDQILYNQATILTKLIVIEAQLTGDSDK